MGTFLIRDIPDELKRKFKALCAERGITMKEAFLKNMKEEVEKAKKGKLQ